MARGRGARAGMALTLVAGLVVAGVTASCSDQAPPKAPNKYADLPPRQVPEYLNGTIMQRAAVYNLNPLQINNWGLVVNLHGTGDSTAPSEVRAYMIRQMVKHGFGSKVLPEYTSFDPERVLRDKRVAIVRVDGLIPPGARATQTFDVMVSALENNPTTSLAHGTLYFTDLFRNGADARMPGSAIDVLGVGEGNLLVNPAYGLIDDPSDAKARASLRYAIIPGGGTVQKDRPIIVRIRHAQLSTARSIEYRVNDYFQQMDVARAYDEGLVQLFVPMSFQGDWRHFVGVVSHLYLQSSSPEFAIAKARQLGDAAQTPGAPLEDISYAWEGLGKGALPIIGPLMSSPKPEIAFAAARAAACMGDSAAVEALGQMAQTPGHPFQVTAIQTLGGLPKSPKIDEMLRGLLDANETTVRVEAYRILVSHEDTSIYTSIIKQRFALDIVPSKGAPLVWASRTGLPRIAIFGSKPALRTPVLFAAMDNRLTISASGDERNVHIFYRDPAKGDTTVVISRPDVAELVARLGGEGPVEDGQFSFTYGDVVSILQAMSDQKLIYGQGDEAGGSMASAELPVPFVLQAVGRLEQEMASAPTLDERPQGELTTEPGTQEIDVPETGEALRPGVGNGSLSTAGAANGAVSGQSGGATTAPVVGNLVAPQQAVSEPDGRSSDGRPSGN